VEGHVTLGFREVCKDLWALGYSIEAGLFTASEVGAPHERKRLFILAYSCEQGLEGCEWSGTFQVEKKTSRQPAAKRRYPARPGQPQYKWEKTRTIKSGLGRTVDGVASRMDKLRLLGNGIVPDQAEKAIRYLLANCGIEKEAAPRQN